MVKIIHSIFTALAGLKPTHDILGILPGTTMNNFMIKIQFTESLNH